MKKRPGFLAFRLISSGRSKPFALYFLLMLYAPSLFGLVVNLGLRRMGPDMGAWAYVLAGCPFLLASGLGIPVIVKLTTGRLAGIISASDLVCDLVWVGLFIGLGTWQWWVLTRENVRKAFGLALPNQPPPFSGGA